MCLLCQCVYCANVFTVPMCLLCQCVYCVIVFTVSMCLLYSVLCHAEAEKELEMCNVWMEMEVSVQHVNYAKSQ